MSIDWSKAPERAVAALIANAKNVHYPRVTYVSGYHRTGCMIRATAASDGSSLSAPDEFWSIEDKPIAWNGEGLPPVGMALELSESGTEGDSEPLSAWLEGDTVEVIAHKEVCGKVIPVVWNTRCESASSVILRVLRPLRTPEQIAEEERAKAIKAMGEAVTSFGSQSDDWHDVFGKLYDAGYRLVEGGAQ